MFFSLTETRLNAEQIGTVLNVCTVSPTISKKKKEKKRKKNLTNCSDLPRCQVPDLLNRTKKNIKAPMVVEIVTVI